MIERLEPNDSALLASIREGEGLRLTAYPDPLSPRGVQMSLPAGKRVAGWSHLPGDPWTNGFGCTAGVKEGDTWTLAQANEELLRAVTKAFGLLDANAPWWRSLSLNRQRVVAELAYNIGWLSRDHRHGLATFHNTLAAMQRGDVASAASGLKTSAWATEVGARATRLIQRYEVG